MKNKFKQSMTALCAALILMGGFSVPAYAQGTAAEPPTEDATNDSNVVMGGFSVPAYAQGTAAEPPTEDATNDSNVVVEEPETPPLTPKGNATLVDDFGGNKQLITVTTKGGNTEDATNDSNVVVEEPETPPLTPKGNATLVDDFGGNKQLITVTTKGGNYFYILIDRAAEGEQTVHFLNQVDEADLMALTETGEATKKPEVCNCTDTVTTKGGNYFYILIDRAAEGEQTVHFLNQVDEADLMALTETGEATKKPEVCNCTEKCEAGKVNTSCPVCATTLTGCTGKEPTPTPTEQPEEPKEKGGNPGAVLALVLFVLLGGGAAFYYFKFVKPKQNVKGNTDLEDFDFEDYDEDEPEADTGEVSENEETEEEAL